MNSPRITAALLVGLLAIPTAASAVGVYEATFTGTFASVDFGSTDPGRFASLGPGDAYELTITTTTTPRTTPNGGVLRYDALSLQLTIDDGVSPTFVVAAGDPGFISVGYVPSDVYFFGFTYGMSDGPFNDDVAVVLLDSDDDPVRTDTDLPLDLDLDAFNDGRALRLTGFFDLPDGGFDEPLALATVDSFEARMVPPPTSAAALALPLVLIRRRRAYQ